MIRVGIAPTKRIPGINSLADQPGKPFFDVLEFWDAMGTGFENDAHFVSYSVIDPEGEEEVKWPRVNKPALPDILSRGGKVVANMMVFDYDTNMNVSEEVLFAHGWDGRAKKLPKVPWSGPRFEEFEAKLRVLRPAFEDANLAFPTFIYTTQNGARFIHLLAQQVPVEDIEDLIRGMIVAYERVGIVMDPACCDWTRLFRLPRVVRDDQRTWEQSYFRAQQDDSWLVPICIEPVKKQAPSVDVYDAIEELDNRRPDPDEARDLLEYTEKGSTRYTEVYKNAKRRLKGRECYGPLFERKGLAEPGQRDATLTSMVGEAVAMLHGEPGMTPEVTFALFLPALEQLEPDAGTPDWVQSGWSKILRFWARESAKMRAIEKKVEKREESAATKLRTIIGKVRGWSKDPELHAEDEVTAMSRLSRMLIVGTPANTFHIMTPSGYYDEQGVKGQFIKGRIVDLKMDDVMPLEEFHGKKVYKVGVADLIDNYATAATRMVGKVSVQGVHLDGSVLMLPLFTRNDEMGARYNEKVDEWILRFVGEDTRDALYRWIAYALDFENGATCALSLSGPAGVGKQMFCRGLSECLVGSPENATGNDLINPFNPSLMRTPFLIVDEGLPRSVPGGLDIADVFRQRVAGEVIRVSEKYLPAIDVYNPLRIVFTANNSDVVQQLAGHRDLTPEDQFALGQRLLHFDLLEDARRWLMERGGKTYTKGWVASETGEPSHFVIARHFLWVYENRLKFGAPGKRFLVEGNTEGRIVQDMRTRSGKAPLIVETLINMIEASPAAISPGANNGIAETEEGIFVTANGVLEFWRSAMTDTGKKAELNHKAVGAVLRSLAKKSKHDTKPTWMQARSGLRLKARWWQIDPALLLRRAVDYGLRAQKLTQLVQQDDPDHPILRQVLELS